MNVELLKRRAAVAPEEIVAALDEFDVDESPKEQTVRGYKVKVTRKKVSYEDVASRRSTVAEVIARSITTGRQ